MIEKYINGTEELGNAETCSREMKKEVQNKREATDAVEKMLKEILEKYMREIGKLRDEGRTQRKFWLSKREKEKELWFKQKEEITNRISDVEAKEERRERQTRKNNNLI